MRHWTLGVMALALGACSDDPKKRLGETCGDNEECISGLCSASVCIDPEGDEDQDGLINSFEIQIGSDPFSADSDGDGILDADELDRGLVVRDTDGDGKPDILESRTRDGDGDCLPDELDPVDDAPATKEELLAHRVELCGAQGLCASAPQGIDIQCINQEVRCDYSNITGYEVEELSCDGLDNNCDGRVDEGCNASSDSDGDGVPDDIDNCPGVANPNQLDQNNNGIGDACENQTLAPPQVTVGSADAWTQETADVPVQGSGLPNSTVLLSQSANCSQSTMVTVDANGQFSQTLTLDRSQANLYAQASHNGELSACVLVQDLFGPIVLHIETSARALDLRPVQFHYPDGTPAGVEVSDAEGSVKLPSAIPGMMVTLIVASPDFSDLGSGELIRDTELRTIQGLYAGNYRLAFANNNPLLTDGISFNVRVPGMAPSHSLYLLNSCGEASYAWADENSGTDEADVQVSLSADCVPSGDDRVELALIAQNENGEVNSYAYVGWLSQADILTQRVISAPNGWQNEGLRYVDLIAQSQLALSFTPLSYAQTLNSQMLLTPSEHTYFLENGAVAKLQVAWPPMESIQRIMTGTGIHGVLASGQDYSKLIHVSTSQQESLEMLHLDEVGVPVPAEVAANISEAREYTNIYIKGWPENYQPTLSLVKVRQWNNEGTFAWTIYAPSQARGNVILPKVSSEFKVDSKLTTLVEGGGHMYYHVSFDYERAADESIVDQVNRIVMDKWEVDDFYMNNGGAKPQAVRPAYSFMRATLNNTFVD